MNMLGKILDKLGLKYECLGMQVISFLDEDEKKLSTMQIYFYKNRFGHKKYKYDQYYHVPQSIWRKYSLNIEDHSYYHFTIIPWMNGLLKDEDLFIEKACLLPVDGNEIEVEKKNNVYYLRKKNND